MSPPHPRLAILGSGPTGLEAALAAAENRWPFTVYEAADHPAAHVRAWGHVRLFTPWSMNVSARMARHLQVAGIEVPEGDGCPTGDELCDRLLDPVAALPEVAPAIRRDSRIVSVGRRGLLKHEEIATAERGAQPFRLLVTDSDGNEELAEADVVLDCTGTYGQPNCTGDGGIPAAGESRLGNRIRRTLPDVAAEESEWAGQTVLVVGSGHSAQTAAVELATFARRHPGTEVVWAVRSPEPTWGAVADDSLPGRASLVARSRALAEGDEPAVRLEPGVVVEALAERDGRVAVTLRNGSTTEVLVDRVLSLTGAVGDASIYRQLQVHECYATAAPINLSAALLGAAGGDCLQQESHGADVLRNPEPNFFILGSKSYGRVNQFLLRVGWEQVDEVFGALSAATPRVTVPSGAKALPTSPRLVNADWNFWPDGFDRAGIWRTCAGLGFEAMEVGVYEPDEELSAAAVKAIDGLVGETGLAVQAVLFSMPAERWPNGGLASPDESARAVAQIIETARRAADLGAEVLGVWPGADRPECGSHDVPDSDGWARTLDAVDAVGEAAGQLGLAVAVEYKPGQLVAGAGDALRLADTLGRSAVGVLVDTAHALAGGEELADLPAQLGRHLVHVHLGDSAGDADADLPPGAEHDFAPFLAALSSSGYGGALSFDLYGSVEAGVATGTEASVQGLRYIRTALARAAR